MCSPAPRARVHYRSTWSLSFPSANQWPQPLLPLSGMLLPPGVQNGKTPARSAHCQAQKEGPLSPGQLCGTHPLSTPPSGIHIPPSLSPSPILHSPGARRCPRVPRVDEGAPLRGRTGACVGKGRTPEDRAAGHREFKYCRHFPHLWREPVLPISHQGSLPTVQL